MPNKESKNLFGVLFFLKSRISRAKSRNNFLKQRFTRLKSRIKKLNLESDFISLESYNLSKALLNFSMLSVICSSEIIKAGLRLRQCVLKR